MASINKVEFLVFRSKWFGLWCQFYLASSKIKTKFQNSEKKKNNMSIMYKVGEVMYLELKVSKEKRRGDGE